MGRTVTIHSVFVTAKLAAFASNRREDVLHCDKTSCFCHNRRAPLVPWALDDFSLVPFVGSNGLSLGRLLVKLPAALRWDEVGISQVLALWDLQKTRLACGALLIAALALSGCSSQLADYSPADAQAHAKDSSGYLPVHDLPPDRDQAIIPPDQRAKIEAELAAARDRQAVAAKDAK
jgi:hypothetical protein